MNRYLLVTELDIKYKHFRTYLKKMEHQRKYGLQSKEILKTQSDTCRYAKPSKQK